MPKFSKFLLVVGVLFIIYGYFGRAANIFFFWESRYIGFAILFIGLIAYLVSRIKVNRTQSKKSLFEKIGIGILIFILLVQAVFFVIAPSTSAYEAAVKYLKEDSNLQKAVGVVDEVSLVPKGSMQMSSSNNSQSGSATFHFIVKGSKKYMDVAIALEKSPASEWTVVAIQ